MKPSIRPQEFYYLYSPIWSDPAEMFKYTIQGLWADGHLSISYKEIYTNTNSKYTRLRTYLKLGSKTKIPNF